MSDLFPPGILGVDIPGCDCAECTQALAASQLIRRAPGRRVYGHTITHLGEQMRPGKYGHRLTREMYALPNKTPTSKVHRFDYSPEWWAAEDWYYEDEDHTRYSDAFCELIREEALINFDLNVAFFSRIPQADFEAALAEMLQKNTQLRPVTNLRDWEGDEGLYVMVFDQYRQVYVGQSSDIRKRVKTHWTGTKEFDRLLCGDTEESVLSIDAFRCLDTTRILAVRTNRADALERKILRALPKEYVLNRVDGGRPDGLRVMMLGLETNRRQLAAADVASEISVVESVDAASSTRPRLE